MNYKDVESEEYPFGPALRWLMAGHDIISDLAGKTRRLRLVYPGDCDCNFVGDDPLIIAVNENEKDQQLCVWLTPQEDVIKRVWKVVPKGK